MLDVNTLWLHAPSIPRSSDAFKVSVMDLYEAPYLVSPRALAPKAGREQNTHTRHGSMALYQPAPKHRQPSQLSPWSKLMIGGRVARCYCDWPRLNKDTLGRARQYSAKTSTLRTKTHSCRAIATMVEVLPVPGGPFEFESKSITRQLFWVQQNI